MLSPGATGRSGADIGANMIVLETRESVNRGGAEGSKRLPESQAIDIPSSAPTLEQSPWSGSHQLAQQSMNEMDHRISLCNIRSQQSAFSASTTHGGASGVLGPRSATPHQPHPYLHQHPQHFQQQQHEQQQRFGQSEPALAAAGTHHGMPRYMESPLMGAAFYHRGVVGGGGPPRPSHRRHSYAEEDSGGGGGAGRGYGGNGGGGVYPASQPRVDGRVPYDLLLAEGGGGGGGRSRNSKGKGESSAYACRTVGGDDPSGATATTAATSSGGSSPDVGGSADGDDGDIEDGDDRAAAIAAGGVGAASFAARGGGMSGFGHPSGGFHMPNGHDYHYEAGARGGQGGDESDEDPGLADTNDDGELFDLEWD